jgi:type IV pilus assembly protein PilN
VRVSINLASRPFADLGPAIRRLRIVSGALIVAALGLWLGLHLLHGRADKVRAREHSLDANLTQLNQESQKYRILVAQPPNAAVINQSTALNALIDKKAFSWTLAMEDLETALPGGVQVTTLEPTVDKKDGHVTVHLRVVGPRDKVVGLVANLEHSHRFLLPRIVVEASETANSSNPNQTLEPVSASNRESFDISADYNPAPRSEDEMAKKKTEAQDKQPQAREENMPSARRAAPTGAQPVRPNRPMKPNPSPGRKPYTSAPPANPPVSQDTRPIPPQAFTGGPR